jgi:hypothetical protein
MAITTQIPQDQWQDFFVTFSNGNCGRMLSMEIFDTEIGDIASSKQGKLMAIDYDPAGKGNDIVVTTGVDEVGYSHTINAPVEVWKAQDESGQIGALEIIDQNNVKTILSLQSS